MFVPEDRVLPDHASWIADAEKRSAFCGDCGTPYDWEARSAEVDRLREALEDATEYVRLASTWTVDTDRHDKLKRAWERGRSALDEETR